MSALSRKLKLRVVYVEWIDSSIDRGWNESYKGETVTIRSVGILSHSTKQSVTISNSQSSVGHFTDQITIPRRAIIKLRWL